MTVIAMSKEPLAPVTAPQPQPAPGQQREVTIQFQQEAAGPAAAAPPPAAPVPGQYPPGVALQYPMYDEPEEEPPRCEFVLVFRISFFLCFHYFCYLFYFNSVFFNYFSPAFLILNFIQ